MCYHADVHPLVLLGEVGTLLLAACLGALIGFERERHDRPAGLRTHILVCLGAALITLVSRHLSGTHYDESRIAAQIVSGIGFLGAGTIFRTGSVVRGLTTAASLWVVAGIGMATAGGGDTMVLGPIAALIAFFTLTVVSRLEDTYIQRRSFQTLFLTMEASRQQVAQLMLGLVERHVEVRRVQIEPGDTPHHLNVQVTLRTPAGFSAPELASWLSHQPGVVGFEWK